MMIITFHRCNNSMTQRIYTKKNEQRKTDYSSQEEQYQKKQLRDKQKNKNKEFGKQKWEKKQLYGYFKR